MGRRTDPRLERRARRNSKDYERRFDSSECMIRNRNIHFMLKRLAPDHTNPPFK